MEIININQSQKSYLQLLEKYAPIILSENVNGNLITRFLDVVTCFWLDKIGILQFEVEYLTKYFNCFILSGVIYLDVNHHEHYAFKILGDYHLLYDPFLKLDNYFRSDINIRQEKDNIRVFQNAYSDTLRVLNNFHNHFYILPIHLMAINNEYEHSTMIQEWYLSFISYTFNTSFANFDDFHETYTTYQEIENGMVSSVKQFVLQDNQICQTKDLEYNINEYLTKTGTSGYMHDKTASEKFIFVFQMKILQVIDILSVSSILNISPAIRSPDVFNTLILVMHSFHQHEQFKKLIEHAIIFYLSYTTIDVGTICKIDFENFLGILKQNTLLDTIKKHIKANSINLFQSNFIQLCPIIKNAIDEILTVSSSVQ